MSSFDQDFSRVSYGIPGDLSGNAHRGTKWHSMQSFGGPVYSKITWAGTGLIEGCNRRKCVLLFIHWNGVYIAEVPDVCNWIQFGRDCHNCKYKDLELKLCRQRIWLRGKTSRQNSTSKLNLIGCSTCFTSNMEPHHSSFESVPCKQSGSVP